MRRGTKNVPKCLLKLPFWETNISLYVEPIWGDIYNDFRKKWKLEKDLCNETTNHGVCISGSADGIFNIVIILSEKSYKKQPLSLLSHEIYHAIEILHASLDGSLGSEAAAGLFGWILDKMYKGVEAEETITGDKK